MSQNTPVACSAWNSKGRHSFDPPVARLRVFLLNRVREGGTLQRPSKWAYFLERNLIILNRNVVDLCFFFNKKTMKRKKKGKQFYSNHMIGAVRDLFGMIMNDPIRHCFSIPFPLQRNSSDFQRSSKITVPFYQWAPNE